MPITSYVCTQPNVGSPGDNGACNVSNGLRVCEKRNGAYPTLLGGNSTVPYEWWSIYPFVVVNIPQGWCVGSVRMEFITAATRLTPFINISIHNMTQLSNNTFTAQAMSSGGTDNSSVVLNLTPLTCGKHLRIDMSNSAQVVLTKIVVSGEGECSMCIVSCMCIYPCPPYPVSTKYAQYTLWVGT